MKTPIKNNLKEYRLKAGMLQKDVAKRLNLVASQDRICHWEKGSAMPSVSNLFKLCRIYNANPLDIYPDF